MRLVIMSGDKWAILALVFIFAVSFVGTMWQCRKPTQPDWRSTMLARWTDEEAICMSEEHE